MQEHMGRLHLGGSDLQYAAIYGTDPEADRDHVFYVSGLQHGTKYSGIAAMLAPLNLSGRIRVDIRAHGQQVCCETILLSCGSVLSMPTDMQLLP